MKRQPYEPVEAFGGRNSPKGLLADGPLVLVVDDDREARSVWAECLSHLGYRSLSASTGEEGIRVAIEERPRVVLMDVTMPGMGGIEATRHLKADERTCDCLVIVVSAHEQAIFTEALHAGCDAFFCKPFNAFALDGILRLLTTQRLARSSPVVKRCACGRSYTYDEWSRLRFYGGVQVRNGREVLEVRNCACGWHIVMPTQLGAAGRNEVEPTFGFAPGPCHQ
jgi:two-component system cell cycle response regulator DivK